MSEDCGQLRLGAGSVGDAPGLAGILARDDPDSNSCPSLLPRLLFPGRLRILDRRGTDCASTAARPAGDDPEIISGASSGGSGGQDPGEAGLLTPTSNGYYGFTVFGGGAILRLGDVAKSLIQNHASSHDLPVACLSRKVTFGHSIAVSRAFTLSSCSGVGR